MNHKLTSEILNLVKMATTKVTDSDQQPPRMQGKWKEPSIFAQSLEHIADCAECIGQWEKNLHPAQVGICKGRYCFFR